MKLICKIILVLGLISPQLKGQYYSNRVMDWQSEEQPNSQQLDHSVLLIGDLGEGDLSRENLKSFKRELQKMGKSGTLLLLGNSVKDPRFESQESDYSTIDSRLRIVLDLVKDYPGEVFVLPGEREWDMGRRNGLNVVKKQEDYIESYLERGDVFLPSGACPGPVEIPLSEEVVLIVVDSQWWLHQWERPQEECGFENIPDFLILLSDALKRNKEKKIIFAAHHPVYSAGKHAGNFAFMGPMEIYRMLFGTTQDFAHPFYKQMRYYAKTIFEDLNEVIFVSAHENSMQYVEKGNIYQLIAGSGNKADYVGKGDMDFTAKELGFGKLNFYKNGEVWVEYWGTGSKGMESPRLIFQKKLYSRKVATSEELAQKYKKLDFSDSTILVSASELYQTTSGMKKRMFGQNYRDEWATRIRVPVFDIGTEKGGLKILKRGGGQQTRSLRLEAKDGKQYVLRSIEKYTEKAIPEILRGTLAAQVVQDGISGSHPYAALAVPKLADAAGVYHTNPQVVYVPDDPRFGIYQKDFKNELFLFEERPEGDQSDAPWFGNSRKVLSTSKLLSKMRKSSEFKVDQKAVMRARLFDLFLNDWDRHDDQWRWATFWVDGKHFARPIPRDRDQVFFYNEGVVPWLSRRKWAIRKFQPFDTITEDLAGLGFNARYFDRSFLTALSGQDWLEMGEELKNRLIDSVIDEAVAALPHELSDSSSTVIKRKLKARRDRLPDMAREFYGFLAQQVDVVGTDDRELFDIARKIDGSVVVNVFPVSKKGKQKEISYARTFLPEETREIRIFGLGGKDKFIVSGQGKKGIRIRLIGGDGKDKFLHEATGVPRKATWIYDTPKKTSIKGNKRITNRLGKQQDVNLYDRKAFKYNVVSPVANLNFVSDDGLVLGAGVALKKQGFRKEPYGALHKFMTSYSFRYPSYKLEYEGEMNHALRGLDFLLDVSYNSPNFQGYYFGLGNTTKLVNKEDEEYNRIRMEQLYVNPMLRKRLGEHHQFILGGFYQRTKLNETAGRFVTDIDNPFLDLDPDIDFLSRKYWGFNLKYVWDTRNSKINPSRGMYWLSEWKWYHGVKKFDNNFHRVSTDMRFYLSFGRARRSVLALRAGAAKNSDGYAFFQANKLGVKSNLRGYQQDRFAGDKMVYQNTDFRMRLLRFRSYFLGGELGLLGFNDFGRVWLKGEHSERWHHGYGAGLWLCFFSGQ